MPSETVTPAEGTYERTLKRPPARRSDRGSLHSRSPGSQRCSRIAKRQELSHKRPGLTQCLSQQILGQTAERT